MRKMQCPNKSCKKQESIAIEEKDVSDYDYREYWICHSCGTEWVEVYRWHEQLVLEPDLPDVNEWYEPGETNA